MTMSMTTNAQTPAPTPDTKPVEPPAEPPKFDSPEVTTEGRVTIHLYQPRAQSVTIQGEWDRSGKQPLTRDEQGLWSITTEPVPPDIYEYGLFLDDLPTLDFKNPHVKGTTRNLVQVSGAQPAFYDPQPGDKGTLHRHWYDSTATGTTRRAHVYTPPGYEIALEQTYPVLFLLHGAGDDDASWSSYFGRAHVILDNLIGQGQAAPMIVVMPMGHIHLPNRTLERSEAYTLLEDDLLSNLLPLIEKNYRVKPGRENRAMAGLSMGGGQSVVIGMKHPELFSGFGVFSAGIWENASGPFETALAAFSQSPHKHELLWIGIGTNDFVYERAQALLARLRQENIAFTYYEDESRHSWPTWRDFLHRFAPLLFPKEKGKTSR